MWQDDFENKKQIFYQQVKAILSARSYDIDSLLRHFGIDTAPFQSNKHGPCPLCGNGTDTFQYIIKEKKMVCGYCDGNRSKMTIPHALVQAGIASWKDIYNYIAIAHSIENPFLKSNPYALLAPPKPVKISSRVTPTAPVTQPKHQRNKWRAKFREAISNHYLFKQYLRNRGIYLNDEDFPDSSRVRLHPNLGYWEKNGQKYISCGKYPTILCVYLNPDNQGGIHRTYLNSSAEKLTTVKINNQQIEVESKKFSKFTNEWAYGIHCELYPLHDSKKLMITEGLETALACYAQYKIPVWSTYTAGELANFIPPNTIRELIIMADYDAISNYFKYPGGAGVAKARELKNRLATEYPHLKVTVEVPNQLQLMEVAKSKNVCFDPKTFKADWLDVFAMEVEAA